MPCRQVEGETMAMRFVVCIQKEGLGDFHGDDLTIGRLYEVLEEDAGHGMTRVIDDSGEDFLYPIACFEAVTVSEPTAYRLHEMLALAA
jgi:hypothetical protein